LRPLAADGAVVAASEPHHSFVCDLQLAPGETKELPPNKVNLADLAPRVHASWRFPAA
jgi:hypothetical protein